MTKQNTVETINTGLVQPELVESAKQQMLVYGIDPSKVAEIPGVEVGMTLSHGVVDSERLKKEQKLYNFMKNHLNKYVGLVGVSC